MTSDPSGSEVAAPVGPAAHPGLREPSTLLRAWELAAAAPAAARAATLLHAAGVQPDLDAALDLDVGACAAACTRLLLDLGGPWVDVVATCPACGDLLEAVAPVTLVDAPAPTGARDDAGSSGPVRVADWWVRAPSTRDLVEVGEVAAGDAGTARMLLLGRCVTPAVDGADLATATAEQLALLDAAAAHLCAGADPVTGFRCPSCAAEVEVALDVGALLWERVAQAAPVLLGEVAALARAFGWTEPDVLALGETRRHAYLALAGTP